MPGLEWRRDLEGGSVAEHKAFVEQIHKMVAPAFAQPGRARIHVSPVHPRSFKTFTFQVYLRYRRKRV